MQKSESVADGEYWEKHWRHTDICASSDNHPICRWLDNQICPGEGLSCFEIGCYPGKFLVLLGNRGYELNGIDLSEKTTVMADWLTSKGFKIGGLEKGDFLVHKLDKQYNLVCSFGFIEHFNNWHDMIDSQLAMTTSEGLCVIEVPNLNSPLYRLLYGIFEPDILKSHKSDAMSLKNITNYINKLNHDIKTADYVGNFYFRFVTKSGRKYRFIEKGINSFKFLFNMLPRSVSARYIGVIVKAN